MKTNEDYWQRVAGAIRRSLSRAVELGVPPNAVAFFARWWQLETWLRQLVYLELRAKYGHRWIHQLEKQAANRSAKDLINRYMASPDWSNVLAYLDVSYLFQLVASDEHWPLFEPSLLPRPRWEGVVDELQELRNRNMHCRRPNDDDLNRVELTLRSLEHGARVALEAHNHRSYFTKRMDDPIAEGWLLQEHQDAKRLIDHCDRHYDVQLQLTWSARPWAQAPEDGIISGREGLLVHALFSVGQGYIEPANFWRDHLSYESPLEQSLVFLILNSPWSPEFTFSAVDGANVLNDVIGNAFDAVIKGREPGRLGKGPLEDDLVRWRKSAERLDVRLHLDSALSVAYPDQPFKVFNA